MYVGGEAHKAVFSIVVQPEITSWADFKGQERVIGAASVRGGTSTVFRSILRAQGLQDGPDYSFVAAGSTSERVAALRNKAIAAGLMAQPQDFMMQDAGFRSLGLTTDFLPSYAIGEVAVRRDWAQANEDVVVRYLRANTPRPAVALRSHSPRRGAGDPGEVHRRPSRSTRRAATIYWSIACRCSRATASWTPRRSRAR